MVCFPVELIGWCFRWLVHPFPPAGLVLAVVMVSSDRAPVSLYQASPSLSGKPSPSQQVAAAQAKVARDLAALRRTEAQVRANLHSVSAFAAPPSARVEGATMHGAWG
jgi:hypothetical protein